MDCAFREGGYESDDMRMLETTKGGKNADLVVELFGQGSLSSGRSNCLQIRSISSGCVDMLRCCVFPNIASPPTSVKVPNIWCDLCIVTL